VQAPKWAGRGSVQKNLCSFGGSNLVVQIVANHYIEFVIVYHPFMLIRLRPYKYLHDRVHITMHNRAHILFNTNLTLQITERRRTSHDALTKGGIAGDITNTMLFMS
jgi:hypothetical protein